MGMNLKETYNRIAKDWVEDHAKDDWWEAGTELFASVLPQRSHILDIGCAGGMKTKFFVQKGFKATGIDLSDKMIEIAEAKVPDADFYVRDITKPLKMNTIYDAIVAQAVLLHIPKNELSEVLKNILESLKQNGYFYASVKGVRPDGIDEAVITENDYGYDYQRFFSFYSLPEFKDFITKAGVEITHNLVTRSGKTDWIEVIGKKK